MPDIHLYTLKTDIWRPSKKSSTIQNITYIKKLKKKIIKKTKTKKNRPKYTQKAIKEVAENKFCFHQVEKM